MVEKMPACTRPARVRVRVRVRVGVRVRVRVRVGGSKQSEWVGGWVGE
jgi:hypothetical protein